MSEVERIRAERNKYLEQNAVLIMKLGEKEDQLSTLKTINEKLEKAVDAIQETTSIYEDSKKACQVVAVVCHLTLAEVQKLKEGMK